MYEEIMDKIMTYRYSFANEHRLDVLKICSKITMHPETYRQFIEEGMNKLSFVSYRDFGPGKTKLLGLDLEPNINVDKNNFEFILKNT